MIADRTPSAWRVLNALWKVDNAWAAFNGTVWAVKDGALVKVWPTPPPPPAAPGATPAYQAGTDRFDLTVTWAAVAGATSYDVRYRTDVGAGWSSWVTGWSGAGLTGTVTGLPGQALYETQVRAVGPGGDGEWSPSASGYTGVQIPEISFTGNLMWLWGIHIREVLVSRPKVGADRSSPGFYQLTDMDVTMRLYPGGTIPSGMAYSITIPRPGQTDSFTVWVGASGATPGATYRYNAVAVTGYGYRESANITAVQPSEPPPDPPSPSGRFSAGALAVSWPAVDNALLYRVRVYDSAHTLLTETTTTGLTVTVTGPTYTVGSSYSAEVSAENTGGGSAYVSTGLKKRIANPYVISADDANTWRNGGWRGGADIYQGYTTTGMNYGVFAYGDKFRDELGAAVLGYVPTITAFKAKFTRQNAGGSFAATKTGVYLHKSGACSGTFSTVLAGGQRENVARGETHEFSLPPDWASTLITQAGGYRGLCLYAPETTIVADGISAHYQIHYDNVYDAGGGVHPGRCEIHHDG